MDMKVKRILESGATAPNNYKMIPMWIIFDVKMGLVVGSHMTEPPASDTYSSVTSKESVRLAFLLSELNGINLVTVNITNAYVNAPCREKVAAVAGPEFGEYEVHCDH